MVQHVTDVMISDFIIIVTILLLLLDMLILRNVVFVLNFQIISLEIIYIKLFIGPQWPPI